MGALLDRAPSHGFTRTPPAWENDNHASLNPKAGPAGGAKYKGYKVMTRTHARTGDSCNQL